MTGRRNPSSFRDPAGFLYERDGLLLRQVNAAFAAEFQLVRTSALLDALVADGLLVPFSEAPLDLALTPDARHVLRAERLPFVSYPAEWCFGQLQDAALLTLDLMRRGLAKDLVLRDATAYNILFTGGRPVFVDLLSFGRYQPGRPWAAYRQFCEHFLAPLALAARVDPALLGLHALHSDGVPVALAARLLGPGAWFSPGLAVHLMWHGRLAARAAPGAAPPSQGLSRDALVRLVEHLRQVVTSLRPRIVPSTWADYQHTHAYAAASLASKTALLRSMLGAMRPARVLDLGANTGVFSRIAAESAGHVAAVDADLAAVEAHYQQVRGRPGPVLPLHVDLMNPVGGSGWAHQEREPFIERAHADVVLALGLAHHLVMAYGVPFPMVAAFIARLAQRAVVEFVPPDDPQAASLRAHRTGETHPAGEDAFRSAFARHFTVVEREPIEGSLRVLYRLEPRTA